MLINIFKQRDLSFHLWSYSCHVKGWWDCSAHMQDNFLWYFSTWPARLFNLNTYSFFKLHLWLSCKGRQHICNYVIIIYNLTVTDREKRKDSSSPRQVPNIIQKQLLTEIVKAAFNKVVYPSTITSNFIVSHIPGPKNEKLDSYSYVRPDAGSCYKIPFRGIENLQEN